MQKLGLKYSTYYRKLRLEIFTTSSVKLITYLLYPEEVLMQSLEKSEENIKAGRLIDISEFKDKLRAKYNV